MTNKTKHILPLPYSFPLNRHPPHPTLNIPKRIERLMAPLYLLLIILVGDSNSSCVLILGNLSLKLSSVLGTLRKNDRHFRVHASLERTFANH